MASSSPQQQGHCWPLCLLLSSVNWTLDILLLRNIPVWHLALSHTAPRNYALRPLQSPNMLFFMGTLTTLSLVHGSSFTLAPYQCGFPSGHHYSDLPKPHCSFCCGPGWIYCEEKHGSPSLYLAHYSHACAHKRTVIRHMAVGSWCLPLRK